MRTAKSKFWLSGVATAGCQPANLGPTAGSVMSKRVDICDVCGARHPEYHFKYKFWRHVYGGFGDVYKERYDICDDCFERIRKAAKIGKASYKNQEVI